ncbi:MAG: DNA translocase FtsK 4TM domain-containing protein, partial [Pedococcus sp.]
MASRPSTSTRSSSPGQARKGTTTRPATRRTAAPRKQPARGKTSGGGLPLPLRAVRGTWMGMAHVAGGAVRKVGHGARDLEPEHRRDGVGFLLLGLSIVVAAREWWALEGPVGDVIHAVVAGTFGRVAYAVPLVLLYLGIRLLRAPQDDGANSRVGIGLGALAFAASGLSHVAAGIPTPPQGAEGMREGGGIIGFLASSPLEAAVSVYGTVPILLMLGFFGLLVMTATPVHMIPERLAELRDHLLHRGAAPDEAVADEPEKPRRRRRVIEPEGPLDGDEAFEKAAVVVPDGTSGLRPGQKRPTAPGVLAPGATPGVAAAAPVPARQVAEKV